MWKLDFLSCAKQKLRRSFAAAADPQYQRR